MQKKKCSNEDDNGVDVEDGINAEETEMKKLISDVKMKSTMGWKRRSKDYL